MKKQILYLVIGIITYAIFVASLVFYVVEKKNLMEIQGWKLIWYIADQRSEPLGGDWESLNRVHICGSPGIAVTYGDAIYISKFGGIFEAISFASGDVLGVIGRWDSFSQTFEYEPYESAYSGFSGVFVYSYGWNLYSSNGVVSMPIGLVHGFSLTHDKLCASGRGVAVLKDGQVRLFEFDFVEYKFAGVYGENVVDFLWCEDALLFCNESEVWRLEFNDGDVSVEYLGENCGGVGGSMWCRTADTLLARKTPLKISSECSGRFSVLNSMPILSKFKGNMALYEYIGGLSLVRVLTSDFDVLKYSTSADKKHMVLVGFDEAGFGICSVVSLDAMEEIFRISIPNELMDHGVIDVEILPSNREVLIAGNRLLYVCEDGYNIVKDFYYPQTIISSAGDVDRVFVTGSNGSLGIWENRKAKEEGAAHRKRTFGQ